jgi:hypothetical protein
VPAPFSVICGTPSSKPRMISSISLRIRPHFALVKQRISHGFNELRNSRAGGGSNAAALGTLGTQKGSETVRMTALILTD